MMKKAGIHCRFCEERHVGCHATCEKYISARKEYDDYLKAKSDAMRPEREANAFHQQCVQRTKKESKNHRR